MLSSDKISKPKRKADASSDKMSKMKSTSNKESKKPKLTKDQMSNTNEAFVSMEDSAGSTETMQSQRVDTALPSSQNSWVSVNRATGNNIKANSNAVSEYIEPSGRISKGLTMGIPSTTFRAESGACSSGLRQPSVSGTPSSAGMGATTPQTKGLRWAQVKLDSNEKYTSKSNENVLYMSGEMQRLTDLNPKVIAEGIHKICGPVKSVQSMASGKLMITTMEADQVEKLIKTRKLLNKYEVSVKIAWNKEIQCGKIYSSSLHEMTLEEILSALQDQDVVGVRKLYTNPRHPCHWYVIAFIGKIPNEIAIEYLKLKVHQYYPSPLICLRCYRYGHSSSNCRNLAKCLKCGNTGHLANECQITGNNFQCSNCRQNHPSLSKQCPYYKNELEVCKLKVELNITFKEARERLLRQKAQNREHEQRNEENEYSSLQSLQEVIPEDELVPSTSNWPLPTLPSLTQRRSYANVTRSRDTLGASNGYGNRSGAEGSSKSEIRQMIKDEIKSTLDSCISETLVKMMPILMRLFLSSSIAEKAECFSEIGEFFGAEKIVGENLNKIAIPTLSCPPLV